MVDPQSLPQFLLYFWPGDSALKILYSLSRSKYILKLDIDTKVSILRQINNYELQSSLSSLSTGILNNSPNQSSDHWCPDLYELHSSKLIPLINSELTTSIYSIHIGVGVIVNMNTLRIYWTTSNPLSLKKLNELLRAPNYSIAICSTNLYS